MRASPVLIVAVALNVALAAALYFRSSCGGSTAKTGSESTAMTQESDPAKLFAWARQRGLPEDVSYNIALAQVHAAAGPGRSEHYWEPTSERAATRRSQEFLALQETRKQLARSFGASVMGQPALAEVFQPYRARLPFLSAEKQISLQQILFETSQTDTEFVGPRPPGTDERLARIRDLLSDEEFAEYQRRESALAVRLANSGFEFTETEFRAAYEVVAAAGLTSRQPLASVMPAIGRVLETSRFEEFKRSQDPIYRSLRSAGKKFDVPHATTVDAYDLILLTQKKAVEVRSTAKNPGTMTQHQEAIFAARDQALKAQLGAEMFQYIAPILQSMGGSRPSWPGDPAGAFLPTR